MKRNVKRWCWEMDLTPKETRFIINYLRFVNNSFQTDPTS